jgi:hypothetical protein
VSSKDPGSPYYFSSPAIKYSDPSLFAQASQVQQVIKKVSGYDVPLKLQRNSSKNYISVYVCSDARPVPDVRQQSIPNNTKKY